MVFLSGHERYTQRTLLRDVHDRLAKQPGCESVRYRPTRRRPRYVVADVDTASFLGQSYAVERARLQVRFWFPVNAEHVYYRINWIEPTRVLMLGFHRDQDHPALGPCHVQLDYEDEPVVRYTVTSLGSHPLTVLDHRLQQLPSALDSITWTDGSPELPDWTA